MKFRKGDLVWLKRDYDGYFSQFKGRVLHVKSVTKKDASIDDDGVCIEEFDEIEGSHLILTKHLEGVG